MITSKESTKLNPRNFEYFLHLGLTKFHTAIALRNPPKLESDEQSAIKTLNLNKFNLGCGIHTLNINDGWLNIEKFGNETPGKFLKSTLFDNESESIFLNFNLRQGIPSDDDFLDYVYHSLLIDMFTYEDALILFEDIYRSLKPGGKHRICTVNSTSLFENFQKRDRSLLNFSNEVYGEKFSIATSDIFDAPGSILSNVIFGYDRKSLWDLEMLTTSLNKIGYKNIKVCAPGFSSDPQLVKVEKSYHQSREKYCIFVECEK